MASTTSPSKDSKNGASTTPTPNGDSTLRKITKHELEEHNKDG